MERELLLDEVTRAIERDPLVRNTLVRMLSEYFMPKPVTESRFDQMMAELQRMREESDKKWEENNKKWKENDKKWKENWAALKKQWEENNKKWEESRREFDKVHDEIMAVSKKIDRTIGALGARWGMQSENTFRKALAGILEENFGVTILNVVEYDDTGFVFGKPDQVELDVIIKNGTLILCELKSSMSKSDVYIFERKARFYEKLHGKKANRLIIISPMVDKKAMEAAEHLGIEVFSDSLEITAL
ncbi:MAG: DUF3782 domain-containing protein [Dissulfuribacterales bacterium]